MTKIAICLSSDNNYAQHLCVTLASILSNKSPEDDVIAYILDGGITDLNKNKILSLKQNFQFEIKFLNIDNNLFKDCPVGKKNHVTLATYYRLILAEICNEDKLLYLDVDLIVKSSLKELFETDITNAYFAGVSDCEEGNNTARLGLETYCNAGVILLNLKKWRENNITKKLFDWMKQNENKIVLHDQDILNSALQDKIIKLDKTWNVQISKYESSKNFVTLLPQAKIIHYVGKHKPWHSDFKQYAKNEYFKYLKLTEYKSYIIPYTIKLWLNIPLLLIGKVLHNIFSIEKQNGIKYLILLGIKFNLNNQ